MGLLVDTYTGWAATLSARVLVGRSPACAVVIEDPRASAEHAAISWSGERWEIRDLGSLNGTWVDGRRLATGERSPLRRDSRLGFGEGGDAWMLVDDHPPGPAARNESTAEITYSTSGLLALPSTDHPRAMISRRPDGTWMLEHGHDQRTVTDRDRFDLDGTRWCLLLPSDLGSLPETLKAEGSPRTLDDVSIWFSPSRDEEHVEVRLRTDADGELLLPARSSHYLLLTLARARLQDAQNGVAPEDQGWIYAAELASMLRYTGDRLNIEIFRARMQLAKLGFADSAQLIARRISSRQLRIGVARLHVSRR